MFWGSGDLLFENYPAGEGTLTFGLFVYAPADTPEENYGLYNFQITVTITPYIT